MQNCFRRAALARTLPFCFALLMATRPAAAQPQTIHLNVSLADLVTVDATVTVELATAENNGLIIEASATGTAMVNGITATIAPQPFTLTVATACRAGTGTVTVTTTPLVVTLSTGLTATIKGTTVTLSASCGRSPELSLTAGPLRASLSDGTSLNVSQTSIALSAPASTVLGTALCTLQRLICDLQALISTGAVADAINLLNTLLAQLNVIPRVAACHVPSPRMHIDIPRNGSQLRQPFVVGGWALDATAPDDPGVDTVHVWAYPASGAAPRFLGASYGRSRPDVAAAFGSQFLLSGFSVHVTGLTPGAYRIVAFGRVTATNGFDVARIADVTIRGGAFVAIDAPAQRATVDRPFLVGGWAADPGASSGTGVNAVHVWAYPVVPAGGGPVFLGSAAYGGHRPDVGAFLGSQFTPSGYNLIVSSLAPGTWDIAVFPLSTVSGAFESARVVRVTVR